MHTNILPTSQVLKVSLEILGLEKLSHTLFKVDTFIANFTKLVYKVEIDKFWKF